MYYLSFYKKGIIYLNRCIYTSKENRYFFIAEKMIFCFFWSFPLTVSCVSLPYCVSSSSQYYWMKLFVFAFRRWTKNWFYCDILILMYLSLVYCLYFKKKIYVPIYQKWWIIYLYMFIQYLLYLLSVRHRVRKRM